jgi:hypothetical protein
MSATGPVVDGHVPHRGQAQRPEPALVPAERPGDARRGQDMPDRSRASQVYPGLGEPVFGIEVAQFGGSATVA